MSSLETMKVVQEVCSAETLQESYLLYMAFKERLKGWRFVLANDRGNFTHSGLHSQFPNTAVVRSLFSTKQVSVLDEYTVEDMQANIQIPFDYSIALDTQALSYLHPYIFGSKQLSEGVDADMVEVFDFLSREDVNCDPSPYLHENTRNIARGDHVDEVYNSLYAYEILKTLDVNKYKSSKKIESLYSDAENFKSVQYLLSSQTYTLNADARLLDGARKRYFQILCTILKIVEIGIGSKKSRENKAISLLEFMHQNMATLMHRELMVGCAFFELGANFDFFDKIHKGNPKLFSYIPSMTWDLLHLREREEASTLLPIEGTRYFFSAFLTFDRRLASVIDKFPVRVMALSPDSIPYNFYQKDTTSFLDDFLGSKVSNIYKFFDESAALDRDLRRENDTSYYFDLAKEIAGRIAEINGSPVPEDFWSVI